MTDFSTFGSGLVGSRALGVRRTGEQTLDDEHELEPEEMELEREELGDLREQVLSSEESMNV